ncbi:MAG: class A beta-lactamase-related serine hydrolase [Sphingobacteriia bacterium]|nr:MAG: class A beta-lactamase-related serine hydrolase [Sphingobacteriia bacterium]
MLRLMIIPVLSLFLLACSGNSQSKDTTVTKPPVVFNKQSQIHKNHYQTIIQPLYEKQLLKTGFNGSILLAKNGETVFEDYQGFINFSTKAPITPSSTFHLASISKTFTAMTILKLMEQGRLKLDDDIRKYLSHFPYSSITIKNLLSHRTGLPKYDLFMSASRSYITRTKNRRGKRIKRTVYVKDPVYITGLSTNLDVLRYLVEIRPPVESMPNRRYSYCNTNYALLALVIEKITGQSYPRYMRDSVFTPLGMKDTYVFSIKDTANYIPSYTPGKIPFGLEKLDCIYGDKNIYSNVRDLLQWDRALYQGTYISNTTQHMAYQPLSNETKGKRNYGLGWHLYVDSPNPTIVYHNGWWHGNNTVFRRLIGDTATVIILGNKFNSNIWSAGKLSSVFTGTIDSKLIDE